MVDRIRGRIPTRRLDPDVTIALAYSGRDQLLEAFRATLREMLAAGVTPDALADGVTGEAARGSSLHARLVGPGPDRQDEPAKSG